MMKKALLLFLATITATALLFSGCGKKETETTPVAEETVEEIDTTEPEEIEPVEEILEEDNSANDINNSSDDISIGGNDVDDEALKEAEEAEEAEQAEEQATDNNQGSSSNGSTEGKYYDPGTDKYYDTVEELLEAFDKSMQESGVKSPEEARAEDEALANGFVDYN